MSLSILLEGTPVIVSSKVSIATNPIQIKQCDCGSLNCDSFACENPQVAETPKELDTYENDLISIRDEDNESTPGTLYSSVSDNFEVVTLDGEEDDSKEKKVRLTPSPPKIDFNITNLEIDQCWCSLRDSKNILVRKYIKEFTEKCRFSKHLQALNATNVVAIDTKHVGTYVRGKCCPIVDRSTFKRTLALARKIDRSPIKFLEDNMDRYCNLTRAHVPKDREQCIIIPCPLDEEGMEKQCRNIKKYKQKCSAKGTQLCMPTCMHAEKPTPLTTPPEQPRSDQPAPVEPIAAAKRGETSDEANELFSIKKPRATPYFPEGIDFPVIHDLIERGEVEICSNKSPCININDGASTSDQKLHEFPGVVKKKKVINIRIYLDRCLRGETPTASNRTHSTYAKCLNDKSKRLAHKTTNKCPMSRCDLSKYCVGKLVADENEARERAIHEQKQLCKLKPYGKTEGRKTEDSKCCGVRCVPDRKEVRERAMKEQQQLCKFPEARKHCLRPIMEDTCCSAPRYKILKNDQVKMIDAATSFSASAESAVCGCFSSSDNPSTNSSLDMTCGNSYYLCRDQNVGCSKVEYSNCETCSLSSRDSKEFSPRCKGPRYCMHLTPLHNKTFYPSAAVQVDSLELMSRPHIATYPNDNQGKNTVMNYTVPVSRTVATPSPIAPIAVPEKEYTFTPPVTTTTNMTTSPPNMATPPNMAIPPNITPPVPVTPIYSGRDGLTMDDLKGSPSIKSKPSSDESAPVEMRFGIKEPVSSLEKIRTKGKPNSSPNTSDEEIEMSILTGRRKITSNEEDFQLIEESGPTRESGNKPVSLKYDFPIYGEVERSRERLERTPSDSIEERIRLLRQNLEKRDEFEPVMSKQTLLSRDTNARSHSNSGHSAERASNATNTNNTINSADANQSITNTSTAAGRPKVARKSVKRG